MIYVLKIVLSYYLILPYYQGFWLNLYIIIKDFERSKRQSWFRPNVVYRAPRGAKMASGSLCNRCYSYWNRHLDLPRMDHEQCLYVHEKERFLFFSNNVWLFRDMRWGYSSSTISELETTFDIDDVEYVDVDLSPASHKYGFSATGMVIDFILKDYDSFATNLNFFTYQPSPFPPLFFARLLSCVFFKIIWW